MKQEEKRNVSRQEAILPSSSFLCFKQRELRVLAAVPAGFLLLLFEVFHDKHASSSKGIQ